MKTILSKDGMTKTAYTPKEARVHFGTADPKQIETQLNHSQPCESGNITRRCEFDGESIIITTAW